MLIRLPAISSIALTGLSTVSDRSISITLPSVSSTSRVHTCIEKVMDGLARL